MSAAETAEAFITRKYAQWERERNLPRRMKDVGREGFHYWFREAGTLMQSADNPENVITIERLRYDRLEGIGAVVGGDPIAYRIGYWVVGRIGHAAGRWTWGQFAPIFSLADYAALYAKARAEGTLLSGSDRAPDLEGAHPNLEPYATSE